MNKMGGTGRAKGCTMLKAHARGEDDERGNVHDRFSVAVRKERLTVGHLPRELSKFCWFFIRRSGTITCRVTGRRRRSRLDQGGMEIPCDLTFEGAPKLVKKLKNAVSNIKL